VAWGFHCVAFASSMRRCTNARTSPLLPAFRGSIPLIPSHHLLYFLIFFLLIDSFTASAWWWCLHLILYVGLQIDESRSIYRFTQHILGLDWIRGFSQEFYRNQIVFVLLISHGAWNGGKKFFFPIWKVFLSFMKWRK